MIFFLIILIVFVYAINNAVISFILKQDEFYPKSNSIPKLKTSKKDTNNQIELNSRYDQIKHKY